MDLVETAGNPAPPGAIVADIRAADGMRLRVARWHCPGEAKGTIVICGGRAEFVEKYFETVADLLARQFVVVVFDWRGQGASGRELDNSRKGHIDDFSLYERDLDALTGQVLDAFCPKPWFALAHSMGATVLLTQSRFGRSPFARMVLTAPMIRLATIHHPALVRLCIEVLDILGFGSSFAPGGGATAAATRPFAENWVSSDPQRYARAANTIAAAHAIGLGGPTIGWVNAAFRSMRQFEDPEFALRTTTPTLVIASGADRIIDLRATERFAMRLKSGSLVVIPYAQHEVLTERDVFRDQFWAAFDAFIPGAHDELSALAEATDVVIDARDRRRA